MKALDGAHRPKIMMSYSTCHRYASLVRCNVLITPLLLYLNGPLQRSIERVL
jgi:hypothetical protein